MSGAQSSEGAGPASTADVPALEFLFLVTQEAERWVAISVRTGHRAESSSPVTAVDLLEQAIDASIAYAVDAAGVTPSQWYDAQELAPDHYVRAAIRAIVRDAGEPRDEPVPDHGYVRRVSVCRIVEAA